jgi:hypothetical protein
MDIYVVRLIGKIGEQHDSLRMGAYVAVERSCLSAR